MTQREAQQEGAATALEETSGPHLHPPMLVYSSAEDVRRLISELGATVPLESIRILDATSQLERIREQYSGTEMADVLDANPPIVVEVSRETLEILTRGRAALGYYMPNSNLIIMAESETISEETANEAMMHEMTHYVGWLGRGWDVQYREGMETVTKNRVVWLEEGLTELLTSRLVENPTEPLHYPLETGVCLWLACACGENGMELLQEAYLSGDFRRIQGIVDNKFGFGTFGRIMESQNGWEATLVNSEAMNDAFHLEAINAVEELYINNPLLERIRLAGSSTSQ